MGQQLLRIFGLRLMMDVCKYILTQTSHRRKRNKTDKRELNETTQMTTNVNKNALKRN